MRIAQAFRAICFYLSWRNNWVFECHIGLIGMPSLKRRTPQIPNCGHHKAAHRSGFAGLVTLCSLLFVALSVAALLSTWRQARLLKQKKAASIASARDHEISERLSAATSSALKKQVARIKQEVRQLPSGNEWAGSYYKGDGLGMNVTLSPAPKSGFVYQNYGCMGLSDQNSGAVHASPNGLVLTFHFSEEESEDDKNPFLLFPHALIPGNYSGVFE